MAPDGSDDASAMEQGHIFREVVSVQVKPVGRDAFQAQLTVRLRPDDPSHPRSLLVELTDEADLVFYHSLIIGEGDFHALKAEQRLRVDFQSFPSQVAELLRRCCHAAADAGSTPAGGPAVGSAAGGGGGGGCGGAAPAEGGLRMLASLDCGASGESMLSIIEANQFRELTHIALKLRQGSDEVVKKHLAGKLRACRAECVGLTGQLQISEQALGHSRRQAEELGARVRVVAEERTRLEQTLEATHHRELAELRQEQASSSAERQRLTSEERRRIEEELRGSLEKALARASKAERTSEELHQQRESLAAARASLQERLETTEAQIQSARREVQELREQTKDLELLKFQHERQIGELRVQHTSFQEQLAGKEQLLASQVAQADVAASQRKNLEEMLVACRQQAHALEDKFSMTAQEISKGNHIIQTLHNGNKQTKAKLKAKVLALTQQEKAVMELEKAGEINKHLLGERDQEILRAKVREARVQQDADELRKKLSEAHEVLKSNQEVIEYLNRQLTERDLRAIPPLNRQAGIAGAFAATSPSPMTGTAGSRSSSLAELLRRAEGAGRGLTGGVAGGTINGGGGAGGGFAAGGGVSANSTLSAAYSFSPEATGISSASTARPSGALGAASLGWGGGVGGLGPRSLAFSPDALHGLNMGFSGSAPGMSPERPVLASGASRGGLGSAGGVGFSPGSSYFAAIGATPTTAATTPLGRGHGDLLQGPISYRKPGGGLGEEPWAVA